MEPKKTFLIVALLSNYLLLQCMEELMDHDPLIMGIIHENPKEVDEALKDINPNYLNERFSPLEYACSFGNQSIVQKLLNAGATIDFQEFDTQKKPRNLTPLTQAVLHGHLELCERLINLGANVNPCNPDNLTPLHAAARKGDPEIVALLIKQKAKLNAQTESEGKTPLHETIPNSTSEQENQKSEKFQICQLLLKAGANPDLQTLYRSQTNAMPVRDKTPLMIAAQQGKRFFVALLLTYGANAEIRDRLSNYPLNYPEISKYFNN